MLLILTGCSSAKFETRQDVKVGYVYDALVCQNIPEIVNKVKEGYGDMKACIVVEAGVLLLPKDAQVK